MHLQANPTAAAVEDRTRSRGGLVGFFLLLVALFLPYSSQGQVPESASPAGQPASSSSKSEKRPPPRRAYAGDAECGSCHQEKAKTYFGTAHHLASYLPDEHPIAGNFAPGSNTLRTSNPFLHFEMSATKEGYFQTAVEELGPSDKISRTEKIAIVAGAARKGQSYLFWKGDELFQLPVAYWTDLASWGNSPGYRDGSPRFDRAIVPRCLECHGSYFEWLPPPVNHYNKNSLVLGIWCEKCHGPGLEHVARNRSKTPPRASTAEEAIVNPASLSRERRMDVCGLCHSGASTPIQPSLAFLPGDVLDDYIVNLQDATSDTPVDVHANQVQLLEKSRCFKSSTTLTCTTCHDVHTPQRDAAEFSPHCLSCHQPRNCGRYAKMGDQIVRNCIDCHMPRQQTQAIFSFEGGRKFQPLVRNHRIAIYPDGSSR
jgi:hypothetical protein